MTDMAQKILLWRESLSVMPDHHFFEIIRMYLGEIKTPYNKQRLIEDLSVFLRRDDNRLMITKLLSKSDLELVTAIKEIPSATQEKLFSFFSTGMTYAALYEQLMNLEERLVIYRHPDKNTGRIIFELNPMLEPALLPHLTKRNLLPAAKLAENSAPRGNTPEVTPPCKLSPEFLAAAYSFLLENPELCKADGTLKKRYEAMMPEVFPAYNASNTAASNEVSANKETSGNGSFISLIIAALENLSLIRLTDCGFSVKTKRWMQFAELDEASQYSYITAAAAGHFPRGILQGYAQLIRDVVAETPEAGFTEEVFLRSIFLHRETKAPVSRSLHSGRFAAILQRAESRESLGIGRSAASNTAASSIGASSVDESSSSATAAGGLNTSSASSSSCTNQTLFQAIEHLGLIYAAGTDVDGNTVYKRTPFPSVVSPEKSEKQENTHVASIDSGFSLTVLPGLPLKNLLPLAQISVPVRYEKILQLEITKNAVMRSFDDGQTPESIQNALNSVLTHELPQNIVFSLSDWYEGYSSASIFRGYVLKIQPQKDVLVENNPEFAPYIQQKLAPGVFLLDFATPKEAMAVIANSGLNFIGSIKNMHEDDVFPDFPRIYHTEIRNEPRQTQEAATARPTTPSDEASSDSAKGTVAYSSNSVNRAGDETNEESSRFIEKLNKIVDGMNLSVEQTEELKSRIQRRIIVNEKQLQAGSVRPEKNEASGMDFLGKIHVTEHAIASESLLNIMYDSVTYLVQPVRIEKQNSDAILKALLQPEGTEKLFQIGRVQYLKRIRGSVFKEPDYK